MTTYGQIFFSKEDFFGAQKSETDISLTAGLISAIYNMTTETQQQKITELELEDDRSCLLYTSPSPRDISGSRMPSSA